MDVNNISLGEFYECIYLPNYDKVTHEGYKETAGIWSVKEHSDSQFNIIFEQNRWE